MSNFTMERICCPECRTEQNTKVWEDIDAKASPKAKAQIIDGSFFVYRCKKCDYKINLTYNCLYHDLDNGIMIWLIPDTDLEEGSKIKKLLEDDMKKLQESAIEEYKGDRMFRIVRTPNQMREKILISEKNMDDRIVEIMKKIYIASLGVFFPENNIKKEDVKEILFDINKEKGEGLVLFTEKFEPVFIPVNDKMYEKVKEDFEDAVGDAATDTFTRVDEKWAEEYIAIE